MVSSLGREMPEGAVPSALTEEQLRSVKKANALAELKRKIDKSLTPYMGNLVHQPKKHVRWYAMGTTALPTIASLAEKPTVYTPRNICWGVSAYLQDVKSGVANKVPFQDYLPQ